MKKVQYKNSKLNIKKYKKELDEKAIGLTKIYRNFKLRLNISSFDYLKHLNKATDSFLRDNNLSRIYRQDARRYIAQKARMIKNEENGKKKGVKQLEFGLEGKL
jgi:hypothetical protein